ncbi:MAG: hypothetical protein ERJ69_01475 [Aphanocapsa feldmannii 288cV]|nr:MAG: hypothetical protein ERJ69_01475 [Aphanocapsa feldmannii 288cV]
MKRLLIVAAAVASIGSQGLAPSAYAGLGAATSNNKGITYDAWCREEGNNCTISFANGKIIVNETDSVDYEDITYITKNSQFHKSRGWNGEYTYIFGIEYLESDASDVEFAEIIFSHTNTAEKFWRDLRRACRECKEVDATQVEIYLKQ